METNQASYQGGEMNDQKNEASPDPEVFARNYQLEALEKAKKENTIVFLETGSGKTLIAIMLLRSYAYELRKPSKYIAVFLVPTVVLVIQQAEAVEKHTNLKVRKLYGDMGVDFWAASTWKRELGQYEVFVMTPAILLNNLQHSFFKLDMIKLLIFDECHNARGRSPYACIMTEFYHRQLCSKATQLPRIFGMTASPVKSKGSSSREVYAKHIQELETLMHSKVYTVANEEVLAKFISYPTTKLNLYKDIDIPYNLFSSLADLMKSLKIKHLQTLEELQLNEAAIEGARKRIRQLYGTFKVCLTELGGWLTLKAAEFLSCNETDILFWGQKKDALGETYAKNFSKDVFQGCSKCVPSDWCIGEDISADINAGFLTAKVECLIQSLVDYRSRRDLRCIIFVERVITAIALQALLSQVPQFSGWETTYMAGNHSGLQSQTRKDQMKIIDAFREGAVNIIIATQILEEGLDVQSCNLVIRFDPAATVCSFIQSRGRARMQGSDYLLLVRSGDSSTLSRVRNYLASGDIMREESVRRASDPCPPLASEMYDEYFYRVESTGALVTLSSAIVLIYLYCSKLPSDRHFKPSPRFEIDEESKMCTLHLPRNCPIQTICVHGPHNMLKKIACLEACKQLHEVGALTDYLLPEFNVEEGVDAEEIGNKVLDDEQYHYFPTELVDSWGAFSERQLYHCYLFCISQNFDYDVTPCTDIVLVVKSELDKEFTATGLQLEVDRGSVTVKIKYDGIVHLSADEVHLARTFQVTILRVLIDRSLSKLKDALKRLDQEDNPSSVSYLLLPSAGSNQNTAIIDWDCVRSSVYLENILSNGIVTRRRQHCSCSVEGVRLVHTSCGVVCKCMLVNSLVFTPHNGHIYCITDILYNMDGNSTMKLREGEILTYKKYFQSRHGHTLRYESESLLAGRPLFSIQNCLRPYLHPYQKGKDSISATVELPPELCAIFMSPISLSTLRSFSFVPSIMHRIEAMFLAVGLKRQMNHYTQNVQVPSIKVLEAITTKKCQEAFSLESLETLGDSFLKYAASQKLFRENKHYHEGILSTKKEKMLSNIALCKLGCNRKLPGFIRNECFDPKMWAIPGEALPGFIDDEVLFSNIYIKGLRQIKIKVIADVVEALIGAYLSTCGELSALLFMDWLGMKVDFMNEIPYPRPVLSRPEIYINISHLQSLLNYSFRDASHLVEAMTHGSYQVPEIPSCYQRLEFLGDSVLDYLITLHMFYTYPGITPGLLTDLRSASVNNECYAHAAVKTGLYKHLLHASAELHKQIILFVDNVDLSVSSSFFGWESETASPKALGDIIESIAGAILIDSGFNKEAVWNSIRPLLEPLVTPNTIKYNPVSELHKICQGRSFMLDYIKTSCDGVAAITAKVEADGMIYRETRSSANKKTSQRLAAKAVLQSLRAHIPGL